MTLRKMLALLLAATMMLSLVACGTNADTKKKSNKDDDEESTSSDLSLYEQAMAYIDEGDLESAYMLVREVAYADKENADAYALQVQLVWMPVEVTFPKDDGTTGRLAATYDDEGRVLTAVNEYEHYIEWVSMRGSYDGAVPEVQTNYSDDTCLSIYLDSWT